MTETAKRQPWLLQPLTVATWLTALFGIAAIVAVKADAPRAVSISLFIVAYITGGWHSTIAGLKALRDFQIEVDLLMVLAAAGAAVLGYWEEGVTLLFLFTLSNALQQFSLDRTRTAVERLMDLHPDQALLRKGDRTEWVTIDQLQPGDVVLVRPGDRIPVDGRVLSGSSWVDEAPVTGESAAVAKQPGDAVYAGTLNQNGALDIEVTRHAGDTVLAKIVRLVAQARSEKGALQLRVERFEQQYAKAVIGLTVLVALAGVLAGKTPNSAVYLALTIMVVASPCAVAIATPAAMLSALAAAARSGVLIKGGQYLEQLGHIQTIAFDKTGTLTQGKHSVVAMIPRPGFTPADVIRFAAAVEAHSEHHLARAIVKRARRFHAHLPVADEITARPGWGVEGLLEGQRVIVGRPAMFPSSESAAWLQRYTDQLLRHGLTVVWVGTPEPIGLIALRDQLRPEAAAALNDLRRLGMRLVMLTGDNSAVAHSIARRVGIDQVYADLLPGEKVEHLRRLAADGPVAMVGDGINDAPALAAADVGIAMGGVGSDIALESADVVLAGDELNRVPYAVRLSRKTARVIKEGLTAAVGVIAVLIVATLAGYVNLSIGVLGHEGSTVLVALSGIRLLAARYRPGSSSAPVRDRSLPERRPYLDPA